MYPVGSNVFCECQSLNSKLIPFFFLFLITWRQKRWLASGVVATKSLLIHPVDAKRARCFIPLMPQDSQPVRIWWHINQDQNTVIITFDENVMQIKSQKDATKAPFKKKIENTST